MITVLRRLLNFYLKQNWSFKINLPRVALQNFFIYTTIQMQPVYFTSIGGSPFLLGAVSSASLLMGGLVSIPSGWYVDNYGVKKIFVFGTLGMSLGSLLFAVSDNIFLGIPGLFLITFSWRFVMNMCPTVCGTALSNSERATGMQLCDTIAAAPKIIAPSVAAALVTIFGGLTTEGIKPLYYIQFGGLLVIALLTWRFFTNPTKREKEPKKVQNSVIDDFKFIFQKGERITTWVFYRVLAYGPWWVAINYWPMFAKEVKGAEQFTISFIQTTMWVLPLFFAIPIGKLADKFGRKLLIYTITPIYSLALLMFIHSRNDIMLIISGLLQGMIMLTSVIQGAIQVELMPIKVIGKWIGFMGLVQGIAGTIYPLLAGFFWDQFSPSSVFYFMIVSSLLSLLVLIRIPETLGS